MLSLHPDFHPPNPRPVPVRLVADLSPDPEAGDERLCATPTCRNVVHERWEETGRYCGRCAIEQDLFDREARRERTFPPGPF